jgi:hypothetical protein
LIFDPYSPRFVINKRQLRFGWWQLVVAKQHEVLDAFNRILGVDGSGGYLRATRPGSHGGNENRPAFINSV